MGLDLLYIDGQTPIDEDEKNGLLIKTISTRSELDEFEQYNIEKAVQWTLQNKFKLEKYCGKISFLNYIEECITKFGNGPDSSGKRIKILEWINFRLHLNYEICWMIVNIGLRTNFLLKMRYLYALSID